MAPSWTSVSDDMVRNDVVPQQQQQQQDSVQQQDVARQQQQGDKYRSRDSYNRSSSTVLETSRMPPQSPSYVPVEYTSRMAPESIREPPNCTSAANPAPPIGGKPRPSLLQIPELVPPPLTPLPQPPPPPLPSQLRYAQQRARACAQADERGAQGPRGRTRQFKVWDYLPDIPAGAPLRANRQQARGGTEKVRDGQPRLPPPSQPDAGLLDSPSGAAAGACSAERGGICAATHCARCDELSRPKRWPSIGFPLRRHAVVQPAVTSASLAPPAPIFVTTRAQVPLESPHAGAELTQGLDRSSCAAISGCVVPGGASAGDWRTLPPPGWYRRSEWGSESWRTAPDGLHPRASSEAIAPLPLPPTGEHDPPTEPEIRLGGTPPQCGKGTITRILTPPTERKQAGSDFTGEHGTESNSQISKSHRATCLSLSLSPLRRWCAAQIPAFLGEAAIAFLGEALSGEGIADTDLQETAVVMSVAESAVGKAESTAGRPCLRARPTHVPQLQEPDTCQKLIGRSPASILDSPVPSDDSSSCDSSPELVWSQPSLSLGY